jgi:NTP pyrophosphatase (non-canonical NTP hydrolase)
MTTHGEMVSALAKSGDQILSELSGADAHLLHMTIGISGEAGELLDAIKKHIIYRKLFDRENVVEELGDLEFYMEGLRQSLGITRDECLAANIAKLQKRYDGLRYSDAAAQARADKVVYPPLAEGEQRASVKPSESVCRDYWNLTGVVGPIVGFETFTRDANGDVVPVAGPSDPMYDIKFDDDRLFRERDAARGGPGLSRTLLLPASCLSFFPVE